jgi:hypothetical protein
LGGEFGKRIFVVVRNGLKHGIPGFERIALRLGVAAAEKNQDRKTPKSQQSLAKKRHPKSDMHCVVAKHYFPANGPSSIARLAMSHSGVDSAELEG